jgi:hypothetical protein
MAFARRVPDQEPEPPLIGEHNPSSGPEVVIAPAGVQDGCPPLIDELPDDPVCSGQIDPDTRIAYVPREGPEMIPGGAASEFGDDWG